MSFIPSPYLVRLQELKLWQGNYDHLLQKNKSQITDCSDLESLNGVTPLNDSKIDDNMALNPGNWDNKALSPVHTFNEIEEKIDEDQTMNVPLKPKRPFLKKGSGLARFNLKPNVIISRSKKCLPSKSKSAITTWVEIEPEQNKPTPLRVPEITIKSKACWSKISENDVCEKINELSATPVFPKRSKNCINFEGDMNDCNNLDQTDKELRLFEALEKKVEQNSFSSNNSSIMRLLSYTPRKPKFANTPKEYQEQNYEVLTKILQNLKLFSQKSTHEYTTDTSLKKSSPDSTFHSELDGDKWSNTNSRAQSPSSFYTDFENTLEKPEKIDAGINTSFVDSTARTQTQFAECSDCIELRNQIENMKKETPDITLEKAKLCDFAKELEMKRDQIHQEVEYIKNKYEKDIEDLQEELVSERSKFEREKALLDTYLKDSRSKKKDREEIDLLKQELIDLKELMKLKDTKNGTTQARLRNQIKQMEKEKLELKSSLENLQKENAKLAASQKVHRNVDTKMLQEINRNLNRLTEETKQLNKPENKSNIDNDKTKRKLRRKSMGDLKEKIDKKLDKQLNKTANALSSADESGDEKKSPSLEVIYDKKCLHSNLEKQYETTFGLTSDKENYIKNMDESKKDIAILSEKTFDDGSREIKYSSGTTKVISPDGKYVYIQYSNGDIKETNLNKHIQKYYFMAKDVWLTKYDDGIELVEFPNGQKEKRFPDGKIEVISPDGTQLIKSPGGTQEINYPDGTKIVTTSEEKIIYFPNGQRETHNKKYKKREYPDGTVKILYPDGSQESRYANGRVRVKDAGGILILDTHISGMK